MMSEPRVRPPLTLRITMYHEYTPDLAHYPPGSTLEDILRLDGDSDAIDDVLEAALERGDVTRKIEVIHDGN